MKIDACCTLGIDREYHLTAPDLLRQMDTAGVDMAVIGSVPRCRAVENATGNDVVLRAAQAHPDRLIATCSVNPWYGTKSVTELRRCADSGARLLVFDPAVQGFTLGDDLADPLIEKLIERDLPLYVHTGGYQHGTPCQLGLAARKHPDASFVMGHAGSTDFKADAVAVARHCANVFIETSLTRPFGALSLLQAIGQDRVVMGSAAPLNDLVFEWRETEQLVPADQHRGFYGGTLATLLGTGES